MNVYKSPKRTRIKLPEKKDKPIIKHNVDPRDQSNVNWSKIGMDLPVRPTGIFRTKIHSQ